MKTIVLAILGLSFVFVSCAGSKSRVSAPCEHIAKLTEEDEGPVSLKRHNRW